VLCARKFIILIILYVWRLFDAQQEGTAAATTTTTTEARTTTTTAPCVLNTATVFSQ